jgi:hypothetical protein
MILKYRLKNPDVLVSIGVTCLAAGLVSQRLVHPTSDFWQGLVAGVSGVLIGLSIVCNVRGLVTRRHRKSGD